MNVGIYIYENAEVLDFSGPFEVFATASRLHDGKAPFDTFLVSENGGTVTARAGYRVNAAYSLHNHPSLDVLLVVGGLHEGELTKPGVIRWIAQQAESAHLVASVCTGAFLLAEAGLLSGRSVTTHWEDLPDFRKRYPHLDVREGIRWVDDGNLVTSAGISAGIDMSLHLVAKLHISILLNALLVKWTSTGRAKASPPQAPPTDSECIPIFLQ
ncbi:MAG: DJ-1/PfpI family protein [Puniceicoccaceae bacterium]